MDIRIEHDLQEVVTPLQLAPARVLRVHAEAINDSAFEARLGFQEAMREVFDRPTPYILRSPFVDRATVDKPEALVYPRYMGGKGVDPAKVLLAQAKGGARRNKRFEVALQRAGILPPGMAAVPSDGIDPAHMDAYGNVKGSFIVQLMSYLNAFSEQGYRANMTDKRRANLAKRGKSENGYVRINGVEYFVSHGPGERNGKQQHLPAGIWSRRGIHGSILAPVFLFTKRMPSYTQSLDLRQVGEAAVNKRYRASFDQRIERILSRDRG